MYECHFKLALTCHFKCSYISLVLRDDDEAITVNDVAANVLLRKRKKHASHSNEEWQNIFSYVCL